MSLQHYQQLILTLQPEAVKRASDIPASFLLAQQGALSSYYIPFEYVNPQARVVLVGITPGLVQWQNAICQAVNSLRAGVDAVEVLRQCKQTGAFSGAMRPNLVAMLDHIGLHGYLGLASCAELFGRASHLVQTTSVLRNPVFINGENYNGTPDMLKHPMLRQQLLDGFARECRQLPEAIYIPLGPKVAKALAWLGEQGYLDSDRVLAGLPHPSGANAERIAYFLGRKDKALLSDKTNPDVLDSARHELQQKVAQLTRVGV